MNFRFRFAVVASALGTALAASALQCIPAAANPDFYLPQGTPILVQPALSLKDAASSMGSGTALNFSVKKDVVVDGWVVIPHGALVRGVVTTNMKGGGNGLSLPAPAASGSAGGMDGMLSAAMGVVNNATFAFSWVQVPAGKVRLDDHPQSVATALMNIGAGAFAAAGNISGMLNKQSPAGGTGGDMAVHAALEAHLAHGVHVPGVSPVAESAAENGGFIDR